MVSALGAFSAAKEHQQQIAIRLSFPHVYRISRPFMSRASKTKTKKGKTKKKKKKRKKSYRVSLLETGLAPLVQIHILAYLLRTRQL